MDEEEFVRHSTFELKGWATFRGGSLRTTGIAAFGPKISPDDISLAADIGVKFEPDFGGAPAAYGKVILGNSASASFGIYQILNGVAEAVQCGNAIATAAGLTSLLTNRCNVEITTTHPVSPINVVARTRIARSSIEVSTVWRLRSSFFDVSWTHDSARVTGLNDFNIQLVKDFPAEPTFTTSCGQKVIFIKRTSLLPQVLVSSCGRWHGALPQTAAVALALGRAVVPFISQIMPLPEVVHPSGTELLPSCKQSRGILAIEIPITQIKFQEVIPTSEAKAA